MQVSEAISNALGRAQNLTFAVFSAALIISVVALTSLSENSNALARVNKEFADVNDVANHSDNVIREIRRYILAKLPSTVSEEGALRDIRHAFSRAYDQSDLASKRLLDAASELPLSLIQQINREFKPMRDVYGAVVSVNVDLAPQSVILLDRLENLRFRDLAVLAHLISVDPISLNEVLSQFNDAWADASPTIITEELVLELADIRTKRQRAAFERLGHYATALREVCERFGRRYSNLAAAGLQSTHARAQDKLVELQDKRGSLEDRLSGEFRISVPIVDQSLPVPIIALLFPLGLVGGYGLIGTALLFTKRKLLSIRDAAKRAEAADNGFVFDQLLTGGLSARTLNWLLLLSITFIPLIAATVLAFQFASALSVSANILMGTFLILAFGVVVMVTTVSYQISTIARGT